MHEHSHAAYKHKYAACMSTAIPSAEEPFDLSLVRCAMDQHIKGVVQVLRLFPSSVESMSTRN